MDFNYKIFAKKTNFEIDHVRGDDLRYFRIEEARTRFTILYVLLHSGCIMGYGWSLQKNVVSAAIFSGCFLKKLVVDNIALCSTTHSQFCIGFLATFVVQVSSARSKD